MAVQDYGVDIDKVEIIGSFASDKSNPGDIDLLVYTPSKTDAADVWNTNQVFEQNQDLWKKIYPDVDLIVIWPENQSWADSIKGHEDTVEVMRVKGGVGSGHRGHRGRPGKRGGSLPSGGGGTSRVWQGEQQAKPEKKLSKLQTGAIGEELAMGALEEKLGAKFSTLNNGVNNAPIDVGGNHHAIEVKTGLASNGRTAQHWRATIGQPGKKETELIKKMSKEEKRAHHTWKKQKILERKNTALREMEKMAGTEIKPATIGVILSPDGKRGDVYFIP